MNINSLIEYCLIIIISTVTALLLVELFDSTHFTYFLLPRYIITFITKNLIKKSEEC